MPGEETMRLIYSGKTKEFTPELEEKVTAKLAKLSKLIEQRGEREAHLTHYKERHLHKVEIVMNFYDRSLISEGADNDLETAVCDAAEKLEAKVLKLRSRWRDTHRDPKNVRSSKENWGEPAAVETAEPEPNNGTVKSAGRRKGSARKPKVFRVNYADGSKPMTLDEALIEMERESDYVVYRDSHKNCLSVLVRRADGNYDLIES